MTVVGTPIMGVGLPLIGGYILPSTLFYIIAEKREMKYNLLPDEFQERFDELEVDWTDMSHAKFNAEAQKCKDADKKKRQK